MRIPVISRLAVLAAVSALAATGTARAEMWNLGGTGGLQSSPGVWEFGSLKAKAYVVDTNNGSANVKTTEVLNSGGASQATVFTGARIGQYTAGLGVTSVAPGPNTDNGTGSPEHTMDNQLGYEFLVFKLPGNYELDSIKLSSFTAGTNTGTGDVDITAWIGGDSFGDFSDFDGKTLGNILGNPSTSTLSGDNFKQLNVTTGSSCGEPEPKSGGPACSNVTFTPSGTNADATGKWLIVASALTVDGSYLVDRDDDTKIKEIVATQRTPPNTSVSEPGTLAMLAAGAGFAFWRRRRQGAAAPSTGG